MSNVNTLAPGRDLPRWRPRIAARPFRALFAIENPRTDRGFPNASHETRSDAIEREAHRARVTCCRDTALGGGNRSIAGLPQVAALPPLRRRRRWRHNQRVSLSARGNHGRCVKFSFTNLPLGSANSFCSPARDDAHFQCRGASVKNQIRESRGLSATRPIECGSMSLVAPSSRVLTVKGEPTNWRPCWRAEGCAHMLCACVRVALFSETQRMSGFAVASRDWRLVVSTCRRVFVLPATKMRRDATRQAAWARECRVGGRLASARAGNLVSRK